MDSSNALKGSNIKAKRERIIPQKRGLLPVSSSTSASSSASTASFSTTTTKVHKTINPSAVPAIVQLQRPVFSSLKGITAEKELERDEKFERRRYTTGLDDEESTNKVIRIEFDSSQAPQPFLEPEFLQRIMEGRRQKKREEEAATAAAEEDEKREIPAESNTRREVRRRAAQTDYGSMAIRDRMNVRKRR
jgi:hypothetical protein